MAERRVEVRGAAPEEVVPATDWDAVWEMGVEFYREWVTDRGDAVSADSLHRIARRAVQAAVIFEKAFNDVMAEEQLGVGDE